MTHHWTLRTGRVSMLISIVFLAFALTAMPAAAETATTTYTDTVLGLELPPGGGTGANCTSPQVAPFLGGAAGALPGFWYAIVPHTSLSTGVAMICTGGQFGLSTQINGQPATVNGVFVDGLVVQTFSSCPGIQTYTVSADLMVAASVGGSVRPGTGSFQNVTLTHLVDANCNAFFAIVSGPVSLTF